jgi:hypothetical protein
MSQKFAKSVDIDAEVEHHDCEGMPCSVNRRMCR